MKDQLISLETSLLAKEKGFNLQTDYGYYERLQHSLEDRRDGSLIEFEYMPPRVLDSSYHDEFNREVGKAPTQSLLQKWLRETQGQDVFVIQSEHRYYPVNNSAGMSISVLSAFIESLNWKSFTKYEEALEEGLLRALKIIK